MAQTLITTPLIRCVDRESDKYSIPLYQTLFHSAACVSKYGSPSSILFLHLFQSGHSWAALCQKKHVVLNGGGKRRDLLQKILFLISILHEFTHPFSSLFCHIRTRTAHDIVSKLKGRVTRVCPSHTVQIDKTLFSRVSDFFFLGEMENSEPEAFLWALTLGAGEREASLPAIQNSRASPFVSSALG